MGEVPAVPDRFDGYAGFYDATYPAAIRERRAAGRIRAALFRTRQARGDWSDAPTPDLVLSAAPRYTGAATIDRGHGRFRVASAPAGNLALIPPGTPTTFLVDGDHELQVLCLPYAALLDFAGAEAGLPEDGDFGVLHARLLVDQALIAALNRLWAASGPGGGGALLSDGLILLVLDRLLALRDARPRVASGGLAAWQVRRVMDHLRDNLACDVSLGELAALLRLSPHHVCRAFKASTGLPPHRMHTRMRMGHAQALLLRTELAIAEVAAAVGYDDPGQFGRAFRKETGLSPSRFRHETRT